MPLPFELQVLVIQQLQEPINLSHYEYDQGTASTLSACCLVCRAWYQIAQPLLYHRVLLKTSNALSSFALAADKGAARHTRRLTLMDSTNGDDLLSSSAVIDMCRVLEGLEGDKFEALLLDRGFRSWKGHEDFDQGLAKRVWDAKTSLHGLRELINVQDEGYIPNELASYNQGWTVHPLLDRLVLYNNLIDDKFRDCLAQSSIKEIISVRPDFTDGPLISERLTVVHDNLNYSQLHPPPVSEENQIINLILKPSFQSEEAQDWIRSQSLRGDLWKSQ